MSDKTYSVSLESSAKPRVVIITDMDLNGSGYMRIISMLGQELVKHGKKVTVFGFQYKGNPHNYPFNILPVVRLSDVIPMIANLLKGGVTIESLVIAMDIPMQTKIADELNKNQLFGKVKTIGIFPLEAEPLSVSWATNLHLLDKRFVMSKFGVMELEKYHIESEFMAMAIDDGTQNTWARRTDEDYKKARKGLGIPDDTLMVLTVADNQERKNLSSGLKALAKYSINVKKRNEIGFATETEVKRPLEWHLVTRINAPIGYDLQDISMREGFINNLKLYERGLPPMQLRQLFLAADLFLLTSKAEGLGIPMLEAMKIGVPTLVTNATAMAEHAGDIEFGDGRYYTINNTRAMTIEPITTIIETFGNGNRSLIDTDDCVSELANFDKNRALFGGMIDRACEYVEKRTWKEAGNQLVNAIDKLNSDNESNSNLSEETAVSNNG